MGRKYPFFIVSVDFSKSVEHPVNVGPPIRPSRINNLDPLQDENVRIAISIPLRPDPI